MNDIKQDTTSNKVIVDSFGVVVLNITIKEILLLRGAIVLPEGSMSFDHQPYTIEQLKLLREYKGVRVGSCVPEGYIINPKKKTCTLKMFVHNFKEERTKEKLGVRSDVEFHLEAGIWVPRKLELGLDKDPPKIFICEVVREPEGFTYKYEVKKIV